ncbi:MAG: hypothetical protein ABI633_07025 [Burkholderiales bacterium]
MLPRSGRWSCTREAAHARPAQARLQAFDEARQAFALALCAREKLGVGGRRARDGVAVQAQVEHGGDEFGAVEPLAKQQQQMLEIARRCGERDLDRELPG